MAIVQTIEYKIEHKYFAGFLQNAIDYAQIKGYIEQNRGVITLALDDSNKEALERFSKFSQKYLPHSIFLGKIETEIKDIEIKEERFTSPPYAIAPCAICMEEITNPASNHYLDDTICCKHYSNSICHQEGDNTYFSPHYNGNDTILLCDATKVKELFLVTDEEIKALFSIEKPTLKFTIKDEELKHLTGKKFMRVKAPYNIKSILVALNAKESGISTLFFNEREDKLEVILIQEHIHMIRDNRLSAKLEPIHQDRVVNRFLNVAKEAKVSSAIGAYLSLKSGINFLILLDNRVKKAIEFNHFDLESVIKSMKRDELRVKLLENFKKRYPKEANTLLEAKGIGLFEAILIIMGFDGGGFDELSDLALEFKGNGGLKIDMNFKDGNFSYEDMLGSIISFRLADTKPHYLAYSIFEAYGDMTIAMLGELKKEYKIDNFLLMGDMFENPILFSRILSKFQISKPYFSTRIALDE